MAEVSLVKFRVSTARGTVFGKRTFSAKSYETIRLADHSGHYIALGFFAVAVLNGTKWDVS